MARSKKRKERMQAAHRQHHRAPRYPAFQTFEELQKTAQQKRAAARRNQLVTQYTAFVRGLEEDVVKFRFFNDLREYAYLTTDILDPTLFILPSLVEKLAEPFPLTDDRLERLCGMTQDRVHSAYRGATRHTKRKASNNLEYGDFREEDEDAYMGDEENNDEDDTDVVIMRPSKRRKRKEGVLV